MNTIVCRKCKVEKNREEFYFRNKSKEIRHHLCKTCQNKYQRKLYRHSKKRRLQISKINKGYRERNRQFILSYLEDHPCIDCGSSDVRALDFDHIRGEKRISVCLTVSRAWSIDNIKVEIAKCEVRCANCHRIRHYEERKLDSENEITRAEQEYIYNLDKGV